MRSRSKVANRVLALLMSVVLVAGLCPGLAVAAESGLKAASDEPALTAADSDALHAQEAQPAMSAQAALDSTSTNNAWKHTYDVWATPASSFLHVNGKSLERVEYVDGQLVVETVSPNLANATSKKVIDPSTYQPSDLVSADAFVWGGFYSGDGYNYVATGQTNFDEDIDRVEFRFTKYKKDWTYVASAEVNCANTVCPFDAGTCDMVELDGCLQVYTAHTMYQDNGGVHHQANAYFSIQESDMSVEWMGVGASTYSNYVSHSFAQCITALGGEIFTVDHGDAFPRAMIIQSPTQYISVMNFPGATGANKTGASLGGLESSETQGNVLIVGNYTVDPEDFDAPRDVWLSVGAAKDLMEGPNMRLTSYNASSTEWADTPFLVKVNDDRFLVIWGTQKEHNTWTGVYEHTGDVYYQFFDGAGNELGDVTAVRAVLSDCQPVVYNGGIVWYAGEGGVPVYYRIDATSGEFSRVASLANAEIHYEGENAQYWDKASDDFGEIGALPYEQATSCPGTRVTIGADDLTEGLDYQLSYQVDHENAQGVITVTGLGGFAGQSCERRFKILRQVFNDYSMGVYGLGDQEYTGKRIEPSIEVYFNGMVLTEDVDYTVSYDENVEVGTAKVVITGKNLFSGTAEYEFEIVPISLKGAIVTLSNDSYTYDGKAKEPKVTVTLDGKTLQADRDYKARYEDNVDVGTATVVVWGKGHYGGSCNAEFKITEPGHVTYTVKFDSKGGSAVKSQTVESGKRATKPGNPTRDGYTFVSWQLNGKDYSFDSKVTGDITLTAKWKQKGSGGSETATVPMYRLYNPYSGEHFYTGDAKERDNVVKAGWNDEQIGWYAPADDKSVPVYRVYNKYGGEHHYTTDKAERDMLVRAGWNDEGIGWYSDPNETVPLLREYNPYQFACNHNYTTDESEHDNLVRIGWVDEGFAWYAVKAGK